MPFLFFLSFFPRYYKRKSEYSQTTREVKLSASTLVRNWEKIVKKLHEPNPTVTKVNPPQQFLSQGSLSFMFSAFHALPGLANVHYHLARWYDITTLFVGLNLCIDGEQM
jgi:hypothetical protein